MAASTFNISLTKRERHRKLRSGDMVTQVRWVLNYKDPKSGQRVQLFFERQKEAIAKRNAIQAAVDTRTYVPAREMITVADAIAAWLEGRRGDVKNQTLHGYMQGARYVTDPVLVGATPAQRRAYTENGSIPEGATLKPTLGAIKIDRLGTADIRAWHKMLSREVGAASASRARKYLGSALSLAAEDMGIRPPMMPTRLKGAPKVRKAILTSEQIVTLLAAAEADLGRGIYVAFPFLAGTRPSEQFGLMWDEVDFEANVIRICRMQEIDGTLCEITKTEAGRRSIPIPIRLRAMLLAWKAMCPRREGEPHRVFPNLGVRQAWPLPRVRGGGTLLYANFRSRIWAPMLKRAGAPYVTPHSARHSYISMLQAEGIEVGLVAKIVGHSSPAVTLSHYTQAFRGGEVASAAVDRAYTA